MENSVNPDQTPHSFCSGLSVPILRVITVYAFCLLRVCLSQYLGLLWYIACCLKLAQQKYNIFYWRKSKAYSQLKIKISQLKIKISMQKKKKKKKKNNFRIFISEVLVKYIVFHVESRSQWIQHNVFQYTIGTQ